MDSWNYYGYIKDLANEKWKLIEKDNIKFKMEIDNCQNRLKLFGNVVDVKIKKDRKKNSVEVTRIECLAGKLKEIYIKNTTRRLSNAS